MFALTLLAACSTSPAPDAPDPGASALVGHPSALARRPPDAIEAQIAEATSLEVLGDTRTGLRLSSPGRISWDVTLPGAATLRLGATALTSGESSLRVEVEVDGQLTAVDAADLEAGGWTEVRADLSRWSGQEVRLHLSALPSRASPGEIFLVDPVVYAPSRSPRRLLMVFVDTLRPDHMSLYGYERQTTPKLAKWAEGAAVFENARSVAPWTLPSARAALSGRQPELWQEGPILPERLAEAGWATGAFVGNAYLGGDFDMSRGWETHTCVDLPSAEEQIERARAFLERHPDRDAAVMLHLMEAHLPYSEPEPYRAMWAPEAPPEGLGTRLLRNSVSGVVTDDNRAETRQYIIDRYDQSLRYLDDQLAALLDDMGEGAIVALFSDHGEEFWEHGGFEHGHTLYDELLRVPLVVKAPGVSAARLSSPVSLLDLTPTVLELVGLEPEGQGVSLLPAIRGEGGARQALEDRHQAFGRPLYGNPRWGVLTEGFKWTSFEGKEELYNLSDDPGEARDLRGTADTAFYRRELGEALHREVPVSWRVEPSFDQRPPARAFTLTLRHPGGFAAAWLGDDPARKSEMTVSLASGAAVVQFADGAMGAREIYLAPAGDPADFAGLTLELMAESWEEPLIFEVAQEAAASVRPDGRGGELLSASGEDRTFSVTFGYAPIPPERGLELVGYDPDSEEALRALGYVE